MMTWFKFEAKSNQPTYQTYGDSATINDSPNYGEDSNGILKAYIPEFLYKPPYGFPRKSNTPYLKQLAKNPYIYSVIKTIVDQVTTMKWDIQVKDDFNEGQDYAEKIKEIKRFLNNPNDNDESFEFILRALLTDVLECDSGVLVKVFNPFGELKQIYCRDGSLFLKNPDIYGTMGPRSDFVLPVSQDMFDHSLTNYTGQNAQEKYQEQVIPRYEAYYRQSAAYFQYGWTAGSMPIPFGRREVIYIMQNPRGDSVYGRPPLEILNSIVLSLIYGSEFNLDFYTNNNMPEGVITLMGAEQEHITQFKQNFEDKFRYTDDFGNKRKKFFKFPIVSQKVDFTQFQLNPQEMDIISQQTWFTKLVWAVFGVTADEMGYTETSNRAVSETQTKAARRKAIKPLLDLLTYYINTQLVTEFFPDGNGKIMPFSEIPVEFKFHDYDFDIDKQKHDILQQELQMGVKTKVMVAQELGIDINELYKTSKEETESEIDKQSRLNESIYGNLRQQNTETKSVPSDVEMKPGMGHSDKWWSMYEELIKQGHSKESAAKITNSKIEEKAMFKHGDDLDSEFNAEQLKKGTEVEKEHTDNVELAKEIAKAHLTEDPQYYLKLEKYIENKSVVSEANKSAKIVKNEIEDYVDGIFTGLKEAVNKLHAQ